MPPIIGIDDVMQLHAGLAQLLVDDGSRLIRFGLINGLPGFVSVEPGDTLQTTTLEIRGGKVAGIYVVRNPDKLQHLAPQPLH